MWKQRPFKDGTLPEPGTKPDVERIVSELSGITREKLLHDDSTYEINGLSRAASIIRGAVRLHKKIFIMGDYDADGICGSTIMFLTIREMGGYAVVRLPKRMSEGYGLKESIVDEFDDGALLITVDNGICARDAIARAKAKNMTVILTDHHLPPEDGILPDADVIIDPNAGTGADYCGYCGAGLTYRIAKELLGEDASKKYLTIAAIATVADVMNLDGENRLIVREGLSLMKDKDCTTAGLRALLRAFSLTEHITSTDIGFKIAPALNAPGRLLDDGAMKSFRLLTFNGRWQDADEKAAELIKYNDQRKACRDAVVAEAERIIAEKHMQNDIPLIVFVPEKPEGVDTIEGIVGNIAGELAERYKTPAIVLTRSEDKPGVLKGSARGGLDVHLKDLLDKNSRYLLSYGGHKDAAGLSLEEKHLDEFRKAMIRSLEGTVKGTDDTVYYDIKADAAEYPELLDRIEEYGPYGTGVPAPVVYLESVQTIPNQTDNGPEYFKLMGGGSTIKFRTDVFDALGFGLGNKAEEFRYGGKLMSFIGTASRNYFGKNVRPQIDLIDLMEDRPPVKRTSTQARLSSIANNR